MRAKCVQLIIFYGGKAINGISPWLVPYTPHSQPRLYKKIIISKKHLTFLSCSCIHLNSDTKIAKMFFTVFLELSYEELSYFILSHKKRY